MFLCLSLLSKTHTVHIPMLPLVGCLEAWSHRAQKKQGHSIQAFFHVLLEVYYFWCCSYQLYHRKDVNKEGITSILGVFSRPFSGCFLLAPLTDIHLVINGGGGVDGDDR